MRVTHSGSRRGKKEGKHYHFWMFPGNKNCKGGGGGSQCDVSWSWREGHKLSLGCDRQRGWEHTISKFTEESLSNRGIVSSWSKKRDEASLKNIYNNMLDEPRETCEAWDWRNWGETTSQKLWEKSCKIIIQNCAPVFTENETGRENGGSKKVSS